MAKTQEADSKVEAQELSSCNDLLMTSPRGRCQGGQSEGLPWEHPEPRSSCWATLASASKKRQPALFISL